MKNENPNIEEENNKDTEKTSNGNLIASTLIQEQLITELAINETVEQMKK